jgi:hypothetical protein
MEMTIVIDDSSTALFNVFLLRPPLASTLLDGPAGPSGRINRTLRLRMTKEEIVDGSVVVPPSRPAWARSLGGYISGRPHDGSIVW